MASLDQRPPIEEPIAKKLGTESAPREEVVEFKRQVIKQFQAHCSAMLLDPVFALPDCSDELSARNGMLVSLEDHFPKLTPDGGKMASLLSGWSVEKLKKAGADGVKFLIFYHPEDSKEVLSHNHRLVREVGQACVEQEIPFLLEILSHPLEGSKMDLKEVVTRSVLEFSKEEYYVDAFLIESPVLASSIPDYLLNPSQNVLASFAELNRLMGRPWIMLSMGADMMQFQNIMRYAYASGASGYLAGRAYWQDALDLYPDWSEVSNTMRDSAYPYLKNLCEMSASEDLPWFNHKGFELSLS